MLDHLSDELRAHYPGRPKQGEIRRYVLAGIRRRNTPEGGKSFTMPNSRSLPDSYTILDGEAIKNIVFVERVIPTSDPNKPIQELGCVEFRVEDACAISISHDNYHTTMNIDMFLFFSPFLTTAITKPWYLKHKWGMFIDLESPELIAASYLDVDQEIHKAKGVVYKMGKEMKVIVIDQLKLGHAARMSEEEITAKLVQYCEIRVNGQAGGGAKRILTLSENKDVALRQLIKTAINMGQIKGSDAGNEMVWVQGGTSICPKLAGKTLEDSMIAFFISNDGREVLGSLKATVEAAAQKARNLKAKQKEAPELLTREQWAEAEKIDDTVVPEPVKVIKKIETPEPQSHEQGEVPPEKREPEPEQPPIDEIPDVADIGAPKESVFPEGQDEFGPLKGTKEWDKLNPQRKGNLNKKRREAQELKDTTIPVLEGSPKETTIDEVEAPGVE